jgi:hypothetical protein
MNSIEQSEGDNRRSPASGGSATAWFLVNSRGDKWGGFESEERAWKYLFGRHSKPEERDTHRAAGWSVVELPNKMNDNYTQHISYARIVANSASMADAQATAEKIKTLPCAQRDEMYFTGLGLRVEWAVRHYYNKTASNYGTPIPDYGMELHVEWDKPQASVYEDPRYRAWRTLTDLAPAWLGMPTPAQHAAMIARLAREGELQVGDLRWDIAGRLLIARS